MLLRSLLLFARGHAASEFFEVFFREQLAGLREHLLFLFFHVVLNIFLHHFELGSPILLRKLGWKQDSLKIGEQVSVEGYLAKDGAKMANARKVTLADGRNIFAGSSADGNPPR